MEQPVPYDVVYHTSQDDEHPITELGHGSLPPLASTGAVSTSATGMMENQRGWQSARNAKMPQLIVLRFPGNVLLTQLRIVSHECKIASRVEVRVFALSGKEMEENPPSFRDVSYTKLGVVELSSNQHSNYRSKERKTIHLRAEAYFLKLLLSTPHHNEHNRFDQVGIYSIECIGQIVSRVRCHFNLALASNDMKPQVSRLELSPSTCVSSPSRQEDYHHHHHHRRPQHRGELISSTTPTPVRDVARCSGGSEVPAFRSVSILQFEDFFIRRSAELMALKEQAVAIEDFDIAKQCRDRINLMNRRSRRIYQLEQDKVQAIIEEEFDAAKEAKHAMDTLIERVYEDARLPKPQRDFNPYGCVGGTQGNEVPCSSSQGGTMEARDVSETGSRVSHGAWSRHRNHSRRQDDGSAHGGDDTETACEEARGCVENRGADDHHCYYYCKNNDTNNNNNNSDDDDADGEAEGCGRERISSAAAAGALVHGVPGDGDDEMNVPRGNGCCADERNDGALALPLIEEAQLQPWERQVARAVMLGSGETDGPCFIGSDVRNTREALDLVAAVGTFTAAALYSRRFKLRESALDVLMENTSLYEAPPAIIEEAVLRFQDVNGYGLQDPIPNVVAAGCGFLRMVLADEHKCLADVVTPIVNLLPRLLSCAADANGRIREEAFATLTLCVKTPLIPNNAIFAALLADPIDKERRRLPTSGSRAQVARLTMLEELLETGRMALRSNVENLWTRLLQPSVNHHSRDVRDLAVSITRKLVRTRKLALTEKRAKQIDNLAIRGELKGVAEQVKSPRAGSSSSSIAVAEAVNSGATKKTRVARQKPTRKWRGGR